MIIYAVKIRTGTEWKLYITTEDRLQQVMSELSKRPHDSITTTKMDLDSSWRLLPAVLIATNYEMYL